jgi:hypothetical protein
VRGAMMQQIAWSDTLPRPMRHRPWGLSVSDSWLRKIELTRTKREDCLILHHSVKYLGIPILVDEKCVLRSARGF